MALALMTKPKHARTGRPVSARNKKAMPGWNHTSRRFGSDAAKIGLPTLAPGHPVIQAKLKIGEPNDKYEQEADRVADAVMRMPEPGALSGTVQPHAGIGRHVQRMCSGCEDEVQRQPMNKEEVQIQAKVNPGHTPETTSDFQSQVDNLKGAGQPLPQQVRKFFEPRYGVDLGGVRVHTGTQSSLLAHAVSARAFTVGDDVVFGKGEYRPHTVEGRRLISHELTHTLQQRPDIVSRQSDAEGATPTPSTTAFRNCTADVTNVATPIEVIRDAIQRAKVMVGDAITYINRSGDLPLLRQEFCHLQRQPPCPTRGEQRSILRIYKRIKRWLDGSPRFVCINHDRRACQRFSAAVLCNQSGARVKLCSGFFSGSGPCISRNSTEDSRAAIIIHEAAHIAGVSCSAESEGSNERYCHDRNYPPRLAYRDCADSYSEFAVAAIYNEGQRRMSEDEERRGIERRPYVPEGAGGEFF